jgi:uncharacterized membrane protein YhfC
MAEKVGFMSILFVAISFILAAGVPVAGIIYLKKDKKLNIKALLWGTVLFIVFVLVLEQILHFFIFGSSPQNSEIYKNPVLYILYFGLVAGIFEETARFIGFKYLLHVKNDESLNTGICYGLGHGGFEAILFGGLPAALNLFVSVMINTGASKIIESMPPALVNTLINAAPLQFLMGGMERFFSIIIQISLSVLVLRAVAHKKWSFYFLAVGLHSIVGFVAVLYQKKIIDNVYYVEGFACVLAIGIALLVYALVIKPSILAKSMDKNNEPL